MGPGSNEGVSVGFFVERSDGPFEYKSTISLVKSSEEFRKFPQIKSLMVTIPGCLQRHAESLPNFVHKTSQVRQK